MSLEERCKIAVKNEIKDKYISKEKIKESIEICKPSFIQDKIDEGIIIGLQRLKQELGLNEKL